MPRQAGDRRIGLATAAEERDVHAGGKMPSVSIPTCLPAIRAPAISIGAWLRVRINWPIDAAQDPLDFPRHDRIVRRPVHRRRIHHVSGRSQRGELPVADARRSTAPACRRSACR